MAPHRSTCATVGEADPAVHLLYNSKCAADPRFAKNIERAQRVIENYPSKTSLMKIGAPIRSLPFRHRRPGFRRLGITKSESFPPPVVRRRQRALQTMPFGTTWAPSGQTARGRSRLPSGLASGRLRCRTSTSRFSTASSTPFLGRLLHQPSGSTRRSIQWGRPVDGHRFSPSTSANHAASSRSLVQGTTTSRVPPAPDRAGAGPSVTRVACAASGSAISASSFTRGALRRRRSRGRLQPAR